MVKKGNDKKTLFIILIVIILICFTFFVYCNINSYGDGKIQTKLASIGYSDDEITLITDKIPNDCYKLLKNYDESIIDLISSKDYDSKLFSKYYSYYSRNKNKSINNIITIVNSGFDLMNYPASKLLASLVLEKYYINKNVARYLDYGNSNKISSKDIVSIVNSNADLEYYNDVKASNLDDGNLILVNKFYYLPDKYEPNDLVTLSSKYNKGSNDKMRMEAAQAFMRMVDAALLDNIVLKNASAYRSYEYQVNLYDSYIKKDGDKNVDIYSAKPGYSEHQTGLCTDINTIDSSFHGTDEANWLLKNAYKYGFIIRFPKGKEKITGYKYEPWHYRYVGEKVAKVIYENDLTFEEYYAYYVEK